MRNYDRLVKRVVIVDDSRTMQALVETAFSARQDFEVVGVAGDARSAVSLIERLLPDVVTIDLCMPYLDGANLLEMTVTSKGICKVIVSDKTASSILMATRLEALGASLCLSKRELIDSPQSFFDKINAAAARVRTKAQNTGPALACARPVEAPDKTIEPRAAAHFGYPIPLDEKHRLAALRRKQLANAVRERAFDLVTRHVAEVTAFPICLMTFIDEDTQWIKSAHGFDGPSTPRDQAFCNYTIALGDAFVVHNAAVDPRFAHNELVTGDFHLRTYVGQPIIARDGTRLGALCLLDTKVRPVARSVIDSLTLMAALFGEMIESRPALAA